MSTCGFCGSELKNVRKTSRAALLAEYKEMFGISFPVEVLESNFRFEAITTRQCRRCGTECCEPPVLGDAAYYTHLSRNLDWYYDPNRWEYARTLELLARDKVQTLLEVGCGRGHFLRRARERGFEAHGYEIEPDSIQALSHEGFHMLDSLNGNLGFYDAILLFQVLEHVADPFSLLQSLGRHLRGGGMLVVSTPMRPSCTSFSANAFLLPPHHQWLPTVAGHAFLAARLGLTCDKALYDPPDPFQIEYGLRKRIELEYGMKQWFGRLPCAKQLARLTLKVARTLGCGWARVGHTVLVIFRKRTGVERPL